MKLYTEEQVRTILDLAKLSVNGDEKYSKDELLESLTPIELPNDDLIWAQAKSVYSDPTVWAPGEELIRCAAYEHGAHWVIQQIKQQAK